MGLNVIFHDAVEQAELKFFLENVEDDRFRYYPSNSQKGKVDYLFFRINSYANKFENTILYAYENNKLVGIIGFRESIWDSDVFGYKCAVIDYFFSKNCNYSEKTRIKEILLKQFDNWCKKSNVRFVTARINVSDLSSIHLLENQNFRFIENILWPIIDFRRDKEVKAVKHKIRFADENDSTALSYLARNFYYRCGRFPADSHFSEKDVANMREKWMQNSIKSNHKIVVVETDDDIGGYFIYFININLPGFPFTYIFFNNMICFFIFLRITIFCKLQ